MTSTAIPIASADAAVWQTDVRGQHAMGEPRQRLLSRVRVDRAEASEVAGIERLQQVERLGTTHLSDEDSIGPVTEGRPQQVGNRDGRQGRLVTQRRLRAPRFEAHPIWLVDCDLGCFLDQHDAVAIRNGRRERVQQRRLARASATRNQDVVSGVHGRTKVSCNGQRERADRDQVVERVSAGELANRQRWSIH
jgi:hypothetical protein